MSLLHIFATTTLNKSAKELLTLTYKHTSIFYILSEEWHAISSLGGGWEGMTDGVKIRKLTVLWAWQVGRPSSTVLSFCPSFFFLCTVSLQHAFISLPHPNVTCSVYLYVWLFNLVLVYLGTMQHRLYHNLLVWICLTACGLKLLWSCFNVHPASGQADSRESSRHNVELCRQGECV